MMRIAPTQKRRNILISVSVLAIAAAAYIAMSPNAPPAPKPLTPALPARTMTSDAAPGFTLQDLQGRSVSLADYRGKVVILDFWATWCPPCKREIPDFIALQGAYASKGLQVVGVALDEPEKVRDYAMSNGMKYPVLLGNDDVVAAYGGISGIPTTYVIDRKGNIVRRFEGFRAKETFEAEIAKLL